MKAFAMTDIGITRTANQDYVYESVDAVGNLPNLFMVADGMGGHKAGEVASCHAVRTAVETIKSSDETDVISIFENAVNEANAALIKKAGENAEYSGMGTTLVLASITDTFLYVGNVGDSRLYFIDEGIHQITRDHSYVEEMVSLGEIGKDEARTHARKNIITRAVGMDSDLTADFFEVQYKSGDKVLMCSDGLSNMVEDEVIRDIVNGEGEIDEKVSMLIKTANDNGGRDNIAVVLIEI